MMTLKMLKEIYNGKTAVLNPIIYDIIVSHLEAYKVLDTYEIIRKREPILMEEIVRLQKEVEGLKGIIKQEHQAKLAEIGELANTFNGKKE